MKTICYLLRRPVFYMIFMLYTSLSISININVKLSKSKIRFLILPGFGNDAIDYTDEFRPEKDFLGLATVLTQRGFETHITPINRISWLNILKGFFSLELYQNKCKPGKLFKFYYDSVDMKLKEMLSNSDDKVVLVCHSAGGWIARGMMSDGNWMQTGTKVEDIISGIITLGSPHIPPIDPNEDMTRGAWKYVNDNFPGAFLSDRIKYITVMGAGVVGDENAPKQSIEGFAYDAYKKLRGEIILETDRIGDGLVPISSGHLLGSLQINLPGIYHGVIAPNNSWYGGDHVVDLWLNPSLELFQ